MAQDSLDFRTETRTSADLAYSSGKYEESARLYSELLGMDLSVPDRAEILGLRGLSLRNLGRLSDAIEDWSAIIDLDGAPVEQVAQALHNRGWTWGQQGQPERELADYTRVIDHLPGAPVDNVAGALNFRAAGPGDSKANPRRNWPTTLASSTTSPTLLSNKSPRRSLIAAGPGDSEAELKRNWPTTPVSSTTSPALPSTKSPRRSSNVA